MPGCKLIEIEGIPKLAVFEVRDGRYHDGLPADKADGFYVCELSSDGSIAQSDTGGDDIVFGPCPTAEAAERMTRDTLTSAGRISVMLERAGLISKGEIAILAPKAVGRGNASNKNTAAGFGRG
jgi:hypothetical protein